jgi:hypothetical protein
MSEEEGEVNNTLPQAIVVWKSQGPRSNRRGTISSLNMVNQENTLRLLVFHEMGKDDVEKHWFNCEAIWSIKIIRDEATKIV